MPVQDPFVFGLGLGYNRSLEFDFSIAHHLFISPELVYLMYRVEKAVRVRAKRARRNFELELVV